MFRMNGMLDALLLLFTIVAVTSSSSSTGEQTDSSCGCDLARDSTMADFAARQSSTASSSSAETSVELDGLLTGSNQARSLMDTPSASSSHNITVLNSKMVRIPGGLALIGTDNPILIPDGEGPERLVRLSDFYIDKYEVSNAGKSVYFISLCV